MKYFLLITLFLYLGPLITCSQQLTFKQRSEKIGLEFVSDIPLSGGTNRFDYQSIDEEPRRLYIAHMGSDMVTVFDIDNGKVIKDIQGLPNVHGVIAVPDLRRIFVSVTGRDKVAVIDENTLQVIANIPVGDYPDGLAYAPHQKRVFVSDEHGKTVSIIDAVNSTLLTKIGIEGEVGNTHYDPVSGRIFSADQTNNQLVAIDPEQLKISQRYDLPGCLGAHGFYIDEQTHYALITGEDNASFIALDLTDGKIIVNDKTGRGPDVLDFDKQKHLLYVASESGTVSVFNVERDHVQKKSEVFFYANAHSVCVDEKTGLVFFPLQNVDGRPVLRIMRSL